MLEAIKPQEAYFWATHAGAELDLLVFRKEKRMGFEFKCSDAPAITKSMRIALADLNLDKIWIIYPGSKSYILHQPVEVISIKDLEIFVEGL